MAAKNKGDNGMYCSHCGAEIHDEAVVCVKCGCQVAGRSMAAAEPKKDSTLATVVKVFLILGCVAQGWLLIPLAWCLPITINVFKKLKAGLPISTGLKVCSLLFVNLIAGVCLLCMEDE